MGVNETRTFFYFEGTGGHRGNVARKALGTIFRNSGEETRGRKVNIECVESLVNPSSGLDKFGYNTRRTRAAFTNKKRTEIDKLTTLQSTLPVNVQ